MKSGGTVLETLTCLATEHDWRLLIAAVFVCVLGTVTCMRLFNQSHNRKRSDRDLMLLVAGLVGGVAVWTTHFIAMMAFQPVTRFDYDLFATLGSLIIAASGVAAGLLIASHLRSTAGRVLGGVLVGATVSAMHYTGMAAVKLQGVIAWETSLVIGGVIVSSVLWAAAWWCSIRAAGDARRRRPCWRCWASAVCISAAWPRRRSPSTPPCR
ncbi:MHYT domain-containing protein [Brevundimonas abyssalis]|uniref:MHYT domain-containing protein n=1 Tax=Brevundimonas abyssalis TaxID=1125965 RepID=UPI0005ECA76F|nr:MHYT domain-containing protein [Brevundimonas abyssalis]